MIKRPEGLQRGTPSVGGHDPPTFIGRKGDPCTDAPHSSHSHQETAGTATVDRPTTENPMNRPLPHHPAMITLACSFALLGGCGGSDGDGSGSSESVQVPEADRFGSK